MLADPEWVTTTARFDSAAMPDRLLEKLVCASLSVCAFTWMAAKLEACCFCGCVIFGGIVDVSDAACFFWYRGVLIWLVLAAELSQSWNMCLGICRGRHGEHYIV